MQLEQLTDLPASDTTALTVRPEKPTKFSLKFRVPKWTEGAWVSVNGEKQNIERRTGTWGAVRALGMPETGWRFIWRFRNCVGADLKFKNPVAENNMAADLESFQAGGHPESGALDKLTRSCGRH